MFSFQYNVWKRMLESLKALIAMSTKRVERVRQRNSRQFAWSSVAWIGIVSLISLVRSQSKLRSAQIFSIACSRCREVLLYSLWSETTIETVAILSEIALFGKFTGAQLLRNFPEVGTVFQINPNLPKCFHTGDDLIEFSLFINMEREDMI